MTQFLKMHGLGNDFVVFDARNQGLALSGSKARAIADRRFGIGCDQVIVIENAANSADAAMRIYNANGGEVESCGNAARCVARLLMDEKHKHAITLETEGGLLACETARDDFVTVDMGVPRLGWREIPLARDVDTKSFVLDVPAFCDPMLNSVAAVNVGNPHCVLFVEDANDAPVATLGPMIEIHPMFPRATNVEFVSVIAKDRLRMRVWERGTGITLACGTGACAAAVAAIRRGLCDAKVSLVLDGGELTLEWHGEGKSVFMTGPGTLSFKGEIDLAELPQ
ncbi:MAG: diaminopimelate epimerase [Proteobacteria bacterium]|nr:diaminopimelate epimerase [Pseudomonadota bacterium]